MQYTCIHYTVPVPRILPKKHPRILPKTSAHSSKKLPRILPTFFGTLAYRITMTKTPRAESCSTDCFIETCDANNSPVKVAKNRKSTKPLIPGTAGGYTYLDYILF
jgi:hypothetical protein